MAQSRLERIGTIYTRITSLMKGGAMKPEDKPVWYDLYEAFPPKVEPRFDRPAPNIPIRDIYYKEDIIRAKFQNQHKRFTVNLFDHDSPSPTQKFLSIYEELKKSGVDESELYQKAVQKWTEQTAGAAKELPSQRKTAGGSVAETAVAPSINVKDIFKE